ncbi:LOW QUALITY PROTEIN: uncharacterized protein SPEM3 [Ochotona princeps]|uniref:LOW QUALITY PROTEIN: uncharacterized protein SPEM3 n=1 Tax=Ochotona princeps TaxID=9978 RepID=UPI002714CD51|nr:LOW QUALITY PROTEIN: uncharacterized protein SPEM3 [Ochotona princeps]
MGERAHHGAQACSGTNPRRCQDLGDSILLILGSFILLNVGINVVTLLWKHLKSSLRILFHHFFPKDKQPSSTSSHPVCLRCSVDPKTLYSRVSSRFHQRSSFLLGHNQHPDSWTPDTNDAKPSRLWMSSPCGHAGAPAEVPWGPWKEGMLGATEAPQAVALKAQTSLLSKPGSFPQFLKTGSKVDAAMPLRLPRESKTKAHAPAQAQSHSAANTPAHMQTHSLTHGAEPTNSQNRGLEHPSAQTPAEVPLPPLTPPPTPNPAKGPRQPSTSTMVQDPAHHTTVPSQVQAPISDHSPQQTHSQAHGPEHTSLQSSVKIPARASVHCQGREPAHPSAQNWSHSEAHGPEHSSTPAPASTIAHSPSVQIHNHTQVSAPASTSAIASKFAPVTTPVPAPAQPVTAQAGDPVSAPSLVMDVTTPAIPAPVPATTPAPLSNPLPSALPAFTQGLSTGHVVYDARRMKQSSFQMYNPQNSGCSRKDEAVLSRPQDGQGLVSSEISEPALKPHDGDGATPSSGPILGYLELGNMEWKVPEDTRDKFFQSKTFSYCSFHPCDSERRNSQLPVYPKFLVYSQDAGPLKPCFHSPTATQNSLATLPPPCTLSLPLVPPRTFVVATNHQKPSAPLQTHTKPPQSIPPPQFPSPPQFSTAASQPLLRPQQPELQENLGLIQDSGHQVTSSPSKDSRVPKKSGFLSSSQNLGLHKQNPGLAQDLGLPKFPGLSQDPYLCTNSNPSQDTGLAQNPGINQYSGPRNNLGPTQEAHAFRNPGLIQSAKTQPLSQSSDLPGAAFMPDSGASRYHELNQDMVVGQGQDLSQAMDLRKSPGMSQIPGSFKNPGHVQNNPDVYRSLGLSQDPRPQKRGPYHTQDPEVSKSSRHSQPAGILKGPTLAQTSGLQKGLGLTQDSGDYKNSGLTQDSAVQRDQGPSQDSEHGKNPDLTQAAEVERRPNLTQDSGVYRSPVYSHGPNLHKGSRVKQEHGSQKTPLLPQDSVISQMPNLTQESGLPQTISFPPDPGLLETRRPSRDPELVRDADAAQIPKAALPSRKSFVSEKAPQENAEQHIAWTSVPINQSPSPSERSQLAASDLQTFSEVPVIIELQSSSRRVGSQDWGYRPMDSVPSACQNYRQMSMPPKINWKAHCPGPGTRTGHVVFDARQKQLAVGRDRCEALAPRRLYQEVPSNTGRRSRSGAIRM